MHDGRKEDYLPFLAVRCYKMLLDGAVLLLHACMQSLQLYHYARQLMTATLHCKPWPLLQRQPYAFLHMS